jgi:hypothetical protein
VDETLKEIDQDEERKAQLQIEIAGHATDTSQDGIDGSKTKADNPVTKTSIKMDTTNSQNAKRA